MGFIVRIQIEAEMLFEGSSMPTILGTSIVAWAIAISAISAVIAVFFSFLQSYRSKQARKAHMFIEISDKWSEMYEIRRTLLGSSTLTKDDLLKKYKKDYKKFFNSPEWMDIRKICNFFEYLGVMLKEGYIEQGPLFVLVTVDIYQEEVEGEQVKNKPGVMYSRLIGPIEYLREVYRKDIYDFYDKYLIPQYKKHKPMKP